MTIYILVHLPMTVNVGKIHSVRACSRGDTLMTVCAKNDGEQGATADDVDRPNLVLRQAAPAFIVGD